MPDHAPPFALYNPAMLAPEVLLSEFTARLAAELLGKASPAITRHFAAP